MTLALMKCGEGGCIKKITGKDEVRRHLAGLGFVEGECVTVISDMGGNMILGVRETRVAVSKNLVQRIIV